MKIKTAGNAYRINNQEQWEHPITLLVHDWEYVHWAAVGEQIFSPELPFAYLGTSPWPGTRTNEETLPFAHPFSRKITKLLLDQGSYGMIVYALSEETLRQPGFAAFVRWMKELCPEAEAVLLKNAGQDLSGIKDELAAEEGLRLAVWEREEEAEAFFRGIRQRVLGMAKPAFHDSLNREWAEWVNYSLSQPLEDREKRILLVGDSISAGYGSMVQELMPDWQVDRLNTSEGLHHPNLIRMLEIILEEYPYQLIHINNGIHIHGISAEEYGRKLEELFQWMEERYPSMKILFAATTSASEKKEKTEEEHFENSDFRLGDRAPVTVSEGEGAEYVYSPESSEAYIRLNEEARKVCGRRGIPFNDLFSLCVSRDLPKTDEVHFREEGYVEIAKAVSDLITKCL